MVPTNPISLEEAFDLVKQKPLERAVQASSNPFDRFMLDLAKTVKEEKKTFIPKKAEVLVEEVFEEECEQPDPIYIEEAMSNLTKALQKARVEAQYKLQEAAKQQELILEEEEIIVEELEPAVPILATSLEGVLTRLAEALKQNDQPEEEKEEDSGEETDSFPEPAVEKKSYIPSSKQENPYVKELIRSTKNEPKIAKGSKKKADIKKLIAEQIGLELEAFRRQLFSSNLMMGGGGGGGTNAVQYAAGGTMRGDLNVMGRILSGGVDISDAIADMIINIEVPPPKLLDAGPY